MTYYIDTTLQMNSHSVEEMLPAKPLLLLDITDTRLKPAMFSPTQNVNILIIEKDWVTALSLQRQLISMGYQVASITQNYETALQEIRNLEIHLVVMDVHLEEGRGSVEVAQEIYEVFKVPVIFVSSNVDREMLSRMTSAHPFGCITKPIKEYDLDAAIQLGLLHHQAEILLKQTLAKEKELNELNSQFVSVVSHEVRNLLHSLMMIFDTLIQYDSKLSLDMRQARLKQGKEMTMSISQLLDDVLVIGEIGRNQFKANPFLIDIVCFCSNLLESLKVSIGSKHQIKFKVQSDGRDEQCDNVFYPLDPKLLQHILRNLLSNAIKYSSPESEVSLTLICSSEGIAFQVQDQGIGIPKQDQEKLFTAFRRATNVGKILGTGLGLAIVKQCVDAHRGILELKSEVGVGTTVTVYFEAQRAYQSELQSGLISG